MKPVSKLAAATAAVGGIAAMGAVVGPAIRRTLAEAVELEEALAYLEAMVGPDHLAVAHAELYRRQRSIGALVAQGVVSTRPGLAAIAHGLRGDIASGHWRPAPPERVGPEAAQPRARHPQ